MKNVNSNITSNSTNNNQLPVAGHIRLAGKMQRAIEALEDLRADAMNLLPSHNQQRQRLETLIDGLIKHGGRLSDVRCHFDNGYNQTISDEHYRTLEAWQPYFNQSTDDRTIGANAWVGTHPTDKEKLIHGFADMLTQLDQDASRKQCNEGHVPVDIIAKSILEWLDTGRRIERFLIADPDHFIDHLQKPENSFARASQEAVLPGESFTIEFRRNGEHFILVFIVSSPWGEFNRATVIPFTRQSNGRWIYPQMFSSISANGGDRRRDYVFIPGEWVSYYTDDPLNAGIYQRLNEVDVDHKNSSALLPHRIAGPLVRLFSIMANHGAIHMHKAPNGSRNPRIGNTFVCRSEGLPMMN